jgi:hypothetical protein
LVALASSLGLLRDVNHHLLPPFAASMVFELRKKHDGKYYINALYGHPQAKPDGDLDKAAGNSLFIQASPPLVLSIQLWLYYWPKHKQDGITYWSQWQSIVQDHHFNAYLMIGRNVISIK